MACAYAKYTGKLACVPRDVATSGPGAIHLLNGLYDAKADNTPVIAITGTTYSDIINYISCSYIQTLQSITI
jgi:pyruvate dehydrogenase (quinone)